MDAFNVRICIVDVISVHDFLKYQARLFVFANYLELVRMETRVDLPSWGGSRGIVDSRWLSSTSYGSPPSASKQTCI